MSNELITGVLELTSVPNIPGLALRGFQGDADYPKMLALINASKTEDEIERSDTVEDIARYYSHLHNCNRYEDMLFAEVDGRVVAYSRVEWNLNDQEEWLGFHLCFLHPDWRRRGIGRAMLHFNETRLRQIADGLLDDGQIQATTPRFYEAFASDTATGQEALLTREGYTPVRYAYTMTRDLAKPVEITSMPPGVEIRPAQPEHYRLIWDASQEAFRDHWNYVPAPEEHYHAWLEERNFNPGLWKIAWACPEPGRRACPEPGRRDGDQVAGMVLNFLDEGENKEYRRKRGYTEGISVRRPWRQRGLARALLTRSLQMFKEMGMNQVALGVDTQNLSGALRLYESVGFRPVQRHTTYRKQL